MSRQAEIALYLLAMVVIIVGVDVAFLRGRFWERLFANIGIVALFVIFYLRIFGGKLPWN